jgi:hypothetical protein
MADRRRNIRIHHEGAVTIAGEGRGGGCYYFRTSLERVTEGVAEFLVPDLVCLSERRSDPRKVLGREIALSVTDGAAEHRFPARLVDEVSVRRSLGEPAQVVIAVGRKRTPA